MNFSIKKGGNSTRIITAYIDDEVADAIDATCKERSMKKSELVKEILRQHFISKNSFDLIVQRIELEDLMNKEKVAELALLDIKKKSAEAALRMEEIQNSVASEWMKKEVEELGLQIDNPEQVILAFHTKVGEIREPWLRARAEDFLQNGGEDEIRKWLKAQNVSAPAPVATPTPAPAPAAEAEPK